MSAFVVDRETVLYLVNAAVSHRISQGGFSWYHDDEIHKLRAGDTTEMIRTANMLWQENIRSVMYRYPDCTFPNLPGRVNETYVIDEKDLAMFWDAFKPIEVLKACRCYEYQACEHPDWWSSEARVFVNSLKDHAVSELPGYEDAPWGAPPPRPERVIRLV